MRHRTIVFGLLLVVSAAGPAASADHGCGPLPAGDADASLARTDHAATGNRVAAGCGPLTGDVTDVKLSGVPSWVLPDPTDRGDSWLVVLEDGSVEQVVAHAGEAAWISQTKTPPLTPGHPPVAAAVGEGQLVVGSALAAAGWFEDAIPDARVTEIEGTALVALSGPTERYAHGVLGDELEASAIDVHGDAGLLARIEVAEQEVIEGTAAMVVELMPDVFGPELLVTVSDAEGGARLRAYGLDGNVIAESAPIGQGYRWLHQIGAGRLAPDGELEIIAVRTPHIGGIVEAYRFSDDRIELVASTHGYSSHQLGSANLDMALLADVGGDDRLDVVVPTQDMGALGVLARTPTGFEEIGRLALEGTLATNVAATPTADGGLVLATGTDDGRLRIFR